MLDCAVPRVNTDPRVDTDPKEGRYPRDGADPGDSAHPGDGNDPVDGAKAGDAHWGGGVGAECWLRKGRPAATTWRPWRPAVSDKSLNTFYYIFILFLISMFSSKVAKCVYIV